MRSKKEKEPEEEMEMLRRYLFEITDGPAPYYTFAYFDTEEHLAHFLFTRAELNVEIEGEYGAEEDPYRIIMCRVPKDQRDLFLLCIDHLPDFMEYAGEKDYDAFCQYFMGRADNWYAKHASGGSRLQ